MKILMIGDVVGRPGRKLLLSKLKDIIQETGADFVSANLENASGGHGITEKNLKQLLNLPIDSVTMGNHVWNQSETVEYIARYPNMVRPANYPADAPGNGYTIIEKNGIRVAVLNLSGQIFMPEIDAPFPVLDRLLVELEGKYDILLTDFHAETTSEKLTMGYFLDATATAVVGTHTHVQTADNRVLPGGTAYITDLGMTGPLNAVLGVKKEIIISNMRTRIPKRFEIDLAYPWQLNGVLIDADEKTGLARSIERVYKIYDKNDIEK